MSAGHEQTDILTLSIHPRLNNTMKTAFTNRLDRLELGNGTVRQVFIISYEDPITGECEINTTGPDGNPIVVTGQEAKALRDRLDSDPYVINVCDT